MSIYGGTTIVEMTATASSPSRPMRSRCGSSLKAINCFGLEEQLRGASLLTLCAVEVQGAREPDRAIAAARLVRDFCEPQPDRKVRLVVCPGLPLSQSPLSTLDRQIVDLLLPLEASGQLDMSLMPRTGKTISDLAGMGAPPESSHLSRLDHTRSNQRLP